MISTNSGLRELKTKIERKQQRPVMGNALSAAVVRPPFRPEASPAANVHGDPDRSESDLRAWADGEAAAWIARGGDRDLAARRRAVTF
jgi:hypothetical protein